MRPFARTRVLPYDTLVEGMDNVRVIQIPVARSLKAELFPDIALADAPDMISYRITRHRQRRHGANHF